jgi:heterodisulfide reductase subunit A-like polyferredoxin
VTINDRGGTGMKTARRLPQAGGVVTLIEDASEIGGKELAAGEVYPPDRLILDWLRRNSANLAPAS